MLPQERWETVIHIELMNGEVGVEDGVVVEVVGGVVEVFDDFVDDRDEPPRSSSIPRWHYHPLNDTPRHANGCGQVLYQAV